MFNLESHEEKYLLCDKLEVLFSWLSFFNLKNKEKVESITSSYLKNNTGGIVWNGVYVWLRPVGRKHWAGELRCI